MYESVVEYPSRDGVDVSPSVARFGGKHASDDEPYFADADQR